jgi:hypothetical protein
VDEGVVGVGGGVAGVREEWLRARARGRAHAREPGRTRSGADGGARRHDGPLADVGATVLRWLTGRDAAALPGDALSERLLATLAAP